MYPSPLMPEGLICTSVTSKSESILTIKFYYVVRCSELRAMGLSRSSVTVARSDARFSRVLPESRPE